MRNDVHLAIGGVDQGDAARRLVRQGERVLAGPGSRALATIVLGCDELELRPERLAEPAPLPRVRAGTVQGNDQLSPARSV
jgi:hypothetical protein